MSKRKVFGYGGRLHVWRVRRRLRRRGWPVRRGKGGSLLSSTVTAVDLTHVKEMYR